MSEGEGKGLRATDAVQEGDPQIVLVSERWPERALMRAALLEEGVETIGARDLYSGMAWLEREQVDLMVVDLPCYVAHG